MCTLTFIPLDKHNYLFTTNRDEMPAREAGLPVNNLVNGARVLYPEDKKEKGTWILCTVTFSMCLLNGAFNKHESNPPYKISRGKVMLEFLNYNSTLDFILNYNFDGVEPFTIVIIRSDRELMLEELRWDGSNFHYRNLDSQKPALWASCVLFDDENQNLRRIKFRNWLAGSDFSQESVLNFHKNMGIDDLLNTTLINSENKVQTLSITQIRKSDKKLAMYYENLLEDKKVEVALK
ncbi:NRDE family protein [Marinifilum sp. RC60d5]|uniref:NRDE family protein n=1 Tax=Marinifilum sp. RC60d5 TaxID=3458414 RepID=UPI0040361EA8